ncbi:retrovirus-related pol polyprotein from transposon TNT 1-94 [Tanacetum coccineum]
MIPSVTSSSGSQASSFMPSKQKIYLKRSVWYLDNGCSRHMTGVKQYMYRYSKEPGPKVVFGDDSSRDTEGYGLVNFLFTKSQGTILNQNDEVVLPEGEMSMSLIYEYSRYTWVFCLKKKSDAADYIISFIRKMENLNEVRVKELRSDNGTEFRNNKLEEFCDEKEAANIACYTQNRSIIVKRHGRTTYDVFRGRSPDISYFHMFGCPVHIHNHRDHLGKFDEKADDVFFLGYSPVAKAFRVFNIKRQEMEETIHVNFSKDDEAISQSSTKGDEISFNENRSFPDDEFLELRNKATQCSANIKYFLYISTYENITPTDSLTLQDSVSSEDPPEFTIVDIHPALSEFDHLELANNLEPTKIQDNVTNEPISDIHHSPSEEYIHLSHVYNNPQFSSM